MKTPGAIRLIAIAMLLAFVGAGCGKQAPHPRAAKIAAAAAKPAAERSFAIIMESFRHSMEDTRIGFVMKDKGGHSMLVGHRKVTEELIRPAKEGDLYKAIITVTSESRYSMSRTQSEAKEEEKRPESEEDQSNIADGTTDESGVEVLDPNLVAKPGDTGSRNPVVDPAKSTIARRPDVDTRKYELIYEGGRWALVTKLDPKTEQSIQHAFDVALRTQS